MTPTDDHNAPTVHDYLLERAQRLLEENVKLGPSPERDEEIRHIHALLEQPPSDTKRNDRMRRRKPRPEAPPANDPLARALQERVPTRFLAHTEVTKEEIVDALRTLFAGVKVSLVGRQIHAFAHNARQTRVGKLGWIKTYEADAPMFAYDLRVNPRRIADAMRALGKTEADIDLSGLRRIADVESP